MLVLSAEHLINSGANRDCYQHPDDPGRCIKLSRRDGGGTRDGMNEIELAHHTAIAQSLGEVFYRHAPRCYGMVDTNLGRGTCFELIRDASEKSSLRLQQYMTESGCSTEHVMGLIDRLEDFVGANQIALFDVNHKNLLVRLDTQGREDLVVIDWKGPDAIREFIPVSRWIPWVARMKIARRFKRLRERVRQMASSNTQTHQPGTAARP